ncbi:hypothetical protein EON03_13440 [Staphylococcus aureus]|nr:hypothetical protein [Staphylococcus aureus]
MIDFHQHQNSPHRNITKCYNKSITQRDKLLMQRRRNHMSITEKQRQQQAEYYIKNSVEKLISSKKNDKI